ncbi:MAG: ATP-dependent protease ATPase subunit HslU, partial [Leptospiraceae bacterium]|nr:ATP-dependent protease ATPase subunit HslU [Leptospiraceae bacterium]
GELEDREVEIETQSQSMPMVEVMTGGPGLEDLEMNIQNMLGDLMPKKQKRRRVSIAEARKIILNEEIERLIDPDKVQTEAIRRTEQMGIIFIDELDKICGKQSGGASGPDVSREGVQRDMLPIVEGATINTRHGPVKTDHILFIAAGAFHMSKPSDLIPELQGRFPIRVELEKLTESDFRLILTGPRNSLTTQAIELMRTEGLELVFNDDAIDEMARFAFQVNEDTENIGARRLHTIMERLLEDISFEAPEYPEEKRRVNINREFVLERLQSIVENSDLSRYIL